VISNRFCNLLCAVAALLCVTTPARADVLEIGPLGAKWITGEAVTETGDLLAPSDMDTGFTTHAAATAGPPEWRARVAELAIRFDLSPALIEALVWQESRWRTNAVSPAGARGLAQLMPATARELGVDPDDPFSNLEGGARYLREQLDRFHGDVEKALAAYNAGPGRVMAAGHVPNIPETQNYVASIMGRLSDHSRSPK
jgi:soluble lytic murein transglycosylase-like protein